MFNIQCVIVIGTSLICSSIINDITNCNERHDSKFEAKLTGSLIVAIVMGGLQFKGINLYSL